MLTRTLLATWWLSKSHFSSNRLSHYYFFISNSSSLPDNLPNDLRIPATPFEGPESTALVSEVPSLPLGTPMQHFQTVGTFHRHSIFGIGEEMEDRAIYAKNHVKCLLIPRYWLLLKDQNMGNVWQRFVHLALCGKQLCEYIYFFFPTKGLKFTWIQWYHRVRGVSTTFWSNESGINIKSKCSRKLMMLNRGKTIHSGMIFRYYAVWVAEMYDRTFWELLEALTYVIDKEATEINWSRENLLQFFFLVWKSCKYFPEYAQQKFSLHDKWLCKMWFISHINHQSGVSPNKMSKFTEQMKPIDL